MNGNSSKSPTSPPLPLRGTSPKGGSKKSAPARGAGRPKGLTEGFRGRQLRFYEIPGEYVAPHLASPVGGAGRLDGTSEPARLTEGVLFDEWQQLKVTNVTPFAAARHFPQRGQQEKRPCKGSWQAQRAD